MAIIPPGAEVPKDLAAEGVRLVNEALPILTKIATLAERAEALEHALDDARTTVDDVDADDAMLDAWTDAIGVTTVRQLLVEMAVCIEHHLGTGAPNRPPEAAREVALAESWLATTAGGGA